MGERRLTVATRPHNGPSGPVRSRGGHSAHGLARTALQGRTALPGVQGGPGGRQGPEGRGLRRPAGGAVQRARSASRTSSRAYATWRAVRLALGCRRQTLPPFRLHPPRGWAVQPAGGGAGTAPNGHARGSDRESDLPPHVPAEGRPWSTGRWTPGAVSCSQEQAPCHGGESDRRSRTPIGTARRAVHWWPKATWGVTAPKVHHPMVMTMVVSALRAVTTVMIEDHVPPVCCRRQHHGDVVTQCVCL